MCDVFTLHHHSIIAFGLCQSALYLNKCLFHANTHTHTHTHTQRHRPTHTHVHVHVHTHTSTWLSHTGRECGGGGGGSFCRDLISTRALHSSIKRDSPLRGSACPNAT